MELLLHQWGDWPELYRNTDKTEATEIVIIDSQMNYRGKLDTYTRGRQVFLSVENYYAEPVPLNEDGYPVTHRLGHGIGMTSVHHFIMSYKGFKNFTQKDGVVRFEVYFTLPDTPLDTSSA